MQDSKQDSKQEKKCNAWPAMGRIFAAYMLRRWLSLRGVGMRGVGMRGLYGTLDNVYSVGVLRLLSLCSANTINSKAARLYALRLYVTRCIYGRTCGALLSVHGIGGHNGRGIIHAVLLHALAVCQRSCNIGHWGI